MRKNQSGFTLIEMLLFTVGLAVVLVAVIGYNISQTAQARREKAALQMQQIANAALSYYVNNGNWPLKNTQCNTTYTEKIAGSADPAYDATQPLVASLYIFPRNSAFGSPFIVWCDKNNSNAFYISISSSNASDVNVLTGMFANTTTSGLSTVMKVDVPGQNVYNARGVNAGSIYHSGACVPTPVCPNGMSPQIVIVTSAVNGVANPPAHCTNPKDYTTCAFITYPVSSYNAYVLGGQSGSSAATLTACTNNTIEPCAQDINNAAVQSGVNYWRVCLQVATQNQGITIQPTNTMTPPPAGNCATQDCSYAWGQAMGNIVAFTRCQPAAENSGANFTVWQP